jgi:hypothetical protein
MFRTGQTLRAEPSYWKSFADLCCEMNCRKFLKCNDGIFCANFSSTSGPFRPCLSAWCGPCYKPLGHKKYPVMVQLDDVGEVIRNPGDEARFMEARAGDQPITIDVLHAVDALLEAEWGRTENVVSR